MNENPLIAQQVKYARVNKQYSLRSVAHYIAILYPSLNIKLINYSNLITTGDQLEGLLLCIVTEDILNESILN